MVVTTFLPNESPAQLPRSPCARCGGRTVANDSLAVPWLADQAGRRPWERMSTGLVAVDHPPLLC